MKKQKKTRTLTIQETSYDRTTRPAITLKGRWLAAAGFAAGTRILLAVEHMRLTITVAATEPACRKK